VKTAWQMEKARIANDAGFSMSCAQRDGCGGDPING